jgi:exosome complex component RRP42
MIDYETKKHIMECLDKSVRYDNRKKDQFREIIIRKGIIATAEGSAHVKCGNTEVIAGVKMSIEKPFPDTPDDGLLMVGAELLPLSNPKYEGGPPDATAIELARLIDRGIRESKAIDNKKLCIKSGEKAWTINVDICPINDNGNLIDVGAMAAVAAIMDAHFPKYENDKIDFRVKSNENIPFNKMPVTITIIKIGDSLIVDPTELEEKSLDARLTLTVMDDDSLCAMQKGGEGTLTIEDVSKMIDLAILKAGEIRKLLKAD